MTAMPSAPPSTGSVPGADLVEQHERGKRQVPIHRHDVGDVRGEGAEAGRDRLLVADVGEERLEDRHARSASTGTCRPACAMAKQARGLQRDGLAAGVRAR